MTAQSHNRTKCNRWSITAYNEEAEQCEALRKGEKDFPPQIKVIHGGLEECPKTGKVHFQGMLETSSVYMSSLKKIFSTAHLEPCRSPEKLLQYVMKEETAVGEKSSSKNSKYVSMDDALELVAIKAKDLGVDWLLEGLTFDNSCKYDYKYGILSSMVLREKRHLVSLYSQPQMMRAWKMYWRVYMDSIEDSSESEEEIIA